jgi:hypothetical protein
MTASSIGRPLPELRAVPLVAALLAAACVGEAERPPATRSAVSPARAEQEAPASAKVGALLYVPVYSHVLHQSGERVMPVTATVSVRNTDLTNAIVVSRADYHGSDGALLGRYVESPIRLGPLASTQFVIAQADRRGGAGASFVVEWHAEAASFDPVVEAVMIGTSRQQGLSFVSQARVLRRIGETAPTETE